MGVLEVHREDDGTQPGREEPILKEAKKNRTEVASAVENKNIENKENMLNKSAERLGVISNKTDRSVSGLEENNQSGDLKKSKVHSDSDISLFGGISGGSGISDLSEFSDEMAGSNREGKPPPTPTHRELKINGIPRSGRGRRKKGLYFARRKVHGSGKKKITGEIGTMSTNSKDVLGASSKEQGKTEGEESRNSANNAEGGVDAPLFIIAKIEGNATFVENAWSEPSDDVIIIPPEDEEEEEEDDDDDDSYMHSFSDPQGITPKKTNDITKIKGWRKKQFAFDREIKSELETDDDREDSDQPAEQKTTNRRLEDSVMKETDVVVKKEPEEVEDKPTETSSAFICDSLDDFLDKEAELHVNYEVPHLSAELGIKLTSEEVASKPNVEKVIQYEMKPPPLNCDSKTRVVGGLSVAKPKSRKSRSQKRKASWDIDDYRYKHVVTGGKKIKVVGSYNLHPKRMLPEQDLLPGKEPIDEALSNFVPEKRLQPDGKVLLYTNPEKEKERKKKRRMLRQYTGTFNEEEEDPEDKVDKGAQEEERETPDEDVGIRLGSKLIGLTVYPGENHPMHSLVQFHLHKLRSYRTRIDKCWANFATSIVNVNGGKEERKRMILPVRCPVILNKPGAEEPKLVEETTPGKMESGEGTEKRARKLPGRYKDTTMQFEKFMPKCLLDCDFSSPIISPKNSKRKWAAKVRQWKKTFNIRDCKVVMYRAEGLKRVSAWCMDHECYACQACGLKNPFCFKYFRAQNSIKKRPCLKRFIPQLGRNVARKRTAPRRSSIEEGARDSSFDETSSKVSQSFDESVAKLLRKKIKELKSSKVMLTTIDTLKEHKKDVVELIRLNFVRENYLSDYINIWYLKPTKYSRSRAFLTFSRSPPFPEAINLRWNPRPVEDLPKVILELTSEKRHYDKTDYAILHCDGHVWEIHGSVNFSVEKTAEPEPEVEKGLTKTQIIFPETDVFPELTIFQDLQPNKTESVPVKWWLVVLSERFSRITYKSGDDAYFVTKSRIEHYIKSNEGGFINLSGKNKRAVGILVSPKILPFGMVGPYLPEEEHNLELTLEGREIPFSYPEVSLDKMETSAGLKMMINSVVRQAEDNSSEVTGVWIHDRVALQQENFIEVNTMKITVAAVPCVGHIENDHGYSFKENPVRVEVDLIREEAQKERNDERNDAQDVYLIPDIPSLGYIKAKMSADDLHVLFRHPLKPKVFIKSTNPGKWLNCFLKTRITCIPRNMEIKWRLYSGPMAESKALPEFNRFCLGGTHILCRKGLFYLLGISEEKIDELDIPKEEVCKAISESVIIKEVALVKALGRMIVGDEVDKQSMPIDKVLNIAIQEIRRLEKQERNLCKMKRNMRTRKWELCRNYMGVMRSIEMSDDNKKKLFLKLKNELLQVVKTYRQEREKRQKLGGKTDEESLVDRAKKIFDEKMVKLDSETSIDTVVSMLELKLSHLYDLLNSHNEQKDPKEYQRLLQRLNKMATYLHNVKRLGIWSKEQAEQKASSKEETFEVVEEIVAVDDKMNKPSPVITGALGRPTIEVTDAASGKNKVFKIVKAPEQISLVSPFGKDESANINETPNGPAPEEKPVDARPKTIMYVQSPLPDPSKKLGKSLYSFIPKFPNGTLNTTYVKSTAFTSGGEIVTKGFYNKTEAELNHIKFTTAPRYVKVAEAPKPEPPPEIKSGNHNYASIIRIPDRERFFTAVPQPTTSMPNIVIQSVTGNAVSHNSFLNAPFILTQVGSKPAIIRRPVTSSAKIAPRPPASASIILSKSVVDPELVDKRPLRILPYPGTRTFSGVVRLPEILPRPPQSQAQTQQYLSGKTIQTVRRIEKLGETFGDKKGEECIERKGMVKVVQENKVGILAKLIGSDGKPLLDGEVNSIIQLKRRQNSPLRPAELTKRIRVVSEESSEISVGIIPAKSPVKDPVKTFPAMMMVDMKTMEQVKRVREGREREKMRLVSLEGRHLIAGSKGKFRLFGRNVSSVLKSKVGEPNEVHVDIIREHSDNTEDTAKDPLRGVKILRQRKPQEGRGEYDEETSTGAVEYLEEGYYSTGSSSRLSDTESSNPPISENSQPRKTVENNSTISDKLETVKGNSASGRENTLLRDVALSNEPDNDSQSDETPCDDSDSDIPLDQVPDMEERLNAIKESASGLPVDSNIEIPDLETTWLDMNVEDIERNFQKLIAPILDDKNETSIDTGEIDNTTL